ncbi:hypothetical protein FJT64_005413 [Amphibalanus amphitrite]|uniref:Uncharacterized protein n=1 Tax=Amphibalanus amphitrite TaxID=1232801 RepID=A0A6A4VW76_AMPAM|nr:hypothetical protein FJT64_005413 [Amphibalanus amphitrite]
MAARADSGAEATVIGEDSLSSICVEPAQLEPCIGQPFSAVGRHPLTCIGSFQAALELGDRSTTAAVFVIKEMTGLLLSWFDCVALGILPRDFPAQIRSVEDAPRLTDDVTHSGDVTPSDDVTPSALPAAAGSARCASDRPTPCETPRDRLCPATGAETGGPAPPADGPSPAAGLGGPLPAWNSDSDPPEAVRAAHAAALVQCYNKSTRRLPALKLGSRVDIQDPTTGRWNRIGVIVGVGQRRTYLVKTASGRVLWRNRRYLRPYRPLLTEPTPPVAPSAPRPPAAGAPQPPPPPPPLPERTAVAAERAVRPAAGAPVVYRSPPVWSPEVETAAAAALPRRSQRQRRGPGRLQVRWGATSYEE